MLLLQDAIKILDVKLANETDRSLKKDSKQLKEIMITDEEWNLLQNLVNVLEQFAVATDYLGGSTYCTYSIINPFIEQIKADLMEPPSDSSSLQPLFSSQSSSSIINQEMDGDDAFAEEDLETQNLSQSENRTSDLLQTVKAKLYENLCEYWNF